MPRSILGSQEAGWMRTWESANPTAAYSTLSQRVKLTPGAARWHDAHGMTTDQGPSRAGLILSCLWVPSTQD